MRSRGGAYRKQQIVRKSCRLSIQTSNNQIIIPKSTFRVVKEQARHSTNQWRTQPINEETRDRQEVGKVVDVYATKSWLREQAHKPSPRVPPATLRLATSTIPGACIIMRSFWELLLLDGIQKGHVPCGILYCNQPCYREIPESWWYYLCRLKVICCFSCRTLYIERRASH